MSFNPDIHILGQGIESWKIWGFLITSFSTVVIGGYKGFQWIKGIRTEDLVEVKGSLATVTQKIGDTAAEQLRSTEFQTTAIVKELAELRGLLYGAFHMPQQNTMQVAMTPARKKAAPRKRKPVVAKLVLDNDE